MPGNDAEVDLGLAELRGVGGDDDVAHHRELAAAAERIARDGGDDGRAHGGELRPAAEVVAHQHLEPRLGLHLLDVGAGGERALRAGDDDRADPLVGIEGGCRRHDVPHHLRVQRVERLGPVERDPADAAARLDQDRLVRDRLVLVIPCSVPIAPARPHPIVCVATSPRTPPRIAKGYIPQARRAETHPLAVPGGGRRGQADSARIVLMIPEKSWPAPGAVRELLVDLAGEHAHAGVDAGRDRSPARRGRGPST